jgi:hypothetical protein
VATRKPKIIEPYSDPDNLRVVAFILESLAGDVENQSPHILASYVGMAAAGGENVPVHEIMKALAGVMYAIAANHENWD